MPIYDVSQTIEDKIPVWPGDQPFEQRWTMRVEAGGFCNLSSVTMSLHTGTHMDAPLHVLPGDKDIASLDLRKLVGPSRVVSLPHRQAISEVDLAHLDWSGIERVLFKTRENDPPAGVFDPAFCYLTAGAGDFLARLPIVLVGIDTPSVDANGDELAVHRKLLGRGIAILEGLRLSSVPDGDYELICLPLKFQGLDGSPVRAILRK